MVSFQRGKLREQSDWAWNEKLAPGTVFSCLKSQPGEHELSSERAEQHRHHTNNEEGKAPVRAETRGCWKPGVKHGVAAVRGLLGHPLAGALTSLVSSVKELAKCQEGE